MDKEFVQHLRYKLQKRIRKLNSTEYPYFHFSLIQFWKWLVAQPTYAGILEDLIRRYPPAEQEAQQIKEGKGLISDNELEHAALAYSIVKLCAESAKQDVEQYIEAAYTGKLEIRLEFFKETFLEALYEYLDEQLDDQRAMLALLRRYKHKCEWLQRDNLFNLWSNDTQRGEKHLAMHLYEYLHDQGLEFSIEPASASGEADLVSVQVGQEPLIVETKIFDPEKGKGRDYIAKGFQQIYRYVVDYNQPFGYLLIYKTCAEDLKVTLSLAEQFTPCITHNNRTIFL